MCSTNLRFITLILTKWMLATEAYMLWTTEYCISSSNVLSVLKNISGKSITALSILFK